jgi:thiol:disulfide interchange protein DsbC
MKKVVEKRDDIVFHIMLYPLVSIHPEAYGKSQSIVCAKSNEEKLQRLEDAFAKKLLPKAECKSTLVDEWLKLGEAFGITGTPAIIFQDGTKVSGAIPEKQLIDTFDKIGKMKK